MILKDGEILNLDCDAVIYIADIHYGLKSSNDNSIKYLEWMDNISGYFKNFFIPKLNEYCSKTYKPLVIVAGDFFDNRRNLRVDVMNSAIDIVETIAKICPIVFCVGNHDTYYTNNNEVNSLRVFNNIKDVYIVERTASVKVCDKTIDIVSWIENGAEESKIVKSSNADILVLHTDINGLKYPSNIKIEGRVEAKGFKGSRIYSGHIHKHQTKGKITYLGSPYEIDKSDAGNTKGIYVNRFDYIKDEGKYELTEEFIENDYSPKFKVYDIEEIQKMKDSGKNIEDVLKNNYVSIKYNGKDAPKYKDLMNSLENCGKGIEFSEIREEVELNESTKDEIKSLSIDDAVYECIDNLNIEDADKLFLKKKHEEYVKSNI